MMIRLTKKKILKTLKYISIIFISALIILFITLLIEINYLNKNVSTDWHDKAEKEINDGYKKMPLEKRQYIDSIKNKK